MEGAEQRKSVPMASTSRQMDLNIPDGGGGGDSGEGRGGGNERTPVQSTPSPHTPRFRIRPPRTPTSNFSIELPDDVSSEDESEELEGGRGSPIDDDDDEDIFPEGCPISSNLRELARKRLRLGSSRSGSPPQSSSEAAFGENGSVYSSVIRRRRQILEGVADDNTTAKDVVLCVFFARERLAAAYYELESAQLCMLPDIADSPPGFETLRSLIGQVNPTYIIINQNSDENFLKVVNEVTGHTILAGPGDSRDEGEEGASAQPSLQRGSANLYCLPAKDFNPNVCKQRVHSLKLQYEPANLNPQEHLMFVTSIIPFGNDNLIRTVGCLLNFLDKSAIELFQIELVERQVPVIDVDICKMDQVVIVDETAWRSLQIFSIDFHPSSFKCGTSSASKEGLSVYSILNQCITTQGAKKLRLMLLRPTRDMEILTSRYDVIGFCINTDNNEFVKSARDYLKSIKSIPKLLYRLSLFHATVAEWKDLYQTMYHCILLAETAGSFASAPLLIKNLRNEDFMNVLRTLTQEMMRVIDFEDSFTSGRIVARQGIDEALDKKKRQYACLPEIMSVVASEEMNDLPPFANQCCVVYIPEIGYLLAVNLWRENLSDDELVLEGIEYRFKSKEFAYYKTARMRELDVILGDCSVAILEKETVIMVRLTQMILEKSSILNKIGDRVSELDTLIALSIVALNYKFVRPTLLPAGSRLSIIDGVHPISDLVCEFVPNSTIFEGSEKVVILTGPNASGKSIYLKQVGVIVILALCGSFVPATSAEIPRFDRICTRIHDIESVATGFSTFVVDVNQMSLSVRSSTRNSLVIIDEFGKGTAEVDGLAILAASLLNFIDKGDSCPTMFLSTHFFSLVQYLEKSSLVKFQTMKFIEHEGSITFLYELQNGHCKSSFAQVVARAQDISENVVKRAVELEAAARGENVAIQPKSTQQQEDMEEAMCNITDEFLELDLSQVDGREFLRKVKRIMDQFK